MADKAEFLQAIDEAILDADSLERFINGDDTQDVLTRLSAEYPTLQKALKELFANGGIAGRFKTLVELQASPLLDGSYALVADDTNDKNGIYIKKNGAWVKSKYDPLTQAKAYTDNFGILPYKLLLANSFTKISSILPYNENGVVGVKPADYSQNHGYLVSVKPNTTYTVYSYYNTNTPKIVGFVNKPSKWDVVNVGTALQEPTPTVINGVGRWHTFTTGSTDNFIVYMNLNESGKEINVAEGSYEAKVWDYLKNSDSIIKYERPVQMNELTVNNLKIASVSSKNLAGDYTYGIYNDGNIELNTHSDNIRKLSASPVIGVYAKEVEPNTTYTISKQVSDRFSVSLSPEGSTSGVIVFRDASKRSCTITTGENDRRLFVQLSNSGERPLVQIEKGDKVTEYKSPISPLDPSSTSSTVKLTEDVVKPTSNTYMDLGTFTDKFRYPANATSWTTDDILNEFYEPLLRDFPHQVSKRVMGKDSSNTYDINAYIFEPESYEQTILLTSGMHPVESAPPFALGSILDKAYRNPEFHEGLAYLRNSTRIIVIPVVNVAKMNENPKSFPAQYLTPNNVNPSRNFPARWDTMKLSGAENQKGAYPLSENETKAIYDLMNEFGEDISFYLDCHTGQGWKRDSMFYYLNEDTYLRPVIDKVISMQTDFVRVNEDRSPIKEVGETARATQIYYPWRIFGIPSAVIEFGSGGYFVLGSEEIAAFAKQLYNIMYYSLRENFKAKRRQDKINSDNSSFISLYNTLDGHNEVLNEVWSYAEVQTNLYDKLGLTKSSLGSISGGYDLVAYTHEPESYESTIVISAGMRGLYRKSVVELGFIAHKLMTENNPHLVEMRNNTRFIFIPCLNPYGHDKKVEANGNGVKYPYQNFATSKEPEAVALKAFVDGEDIDFYINLDGGLPVAKPSNYSNLQVIHNGKATYSYRAIKSVLNSKYSVSPDFGVAKVSDGLTPSAITEYIDSKGIAYLYLFQVQNVLPKRVAIELTDYGYEANELSYTAEILLNAAKGISRNIATAKVLGEHYGVRGA